MAGMNFRVRVMRVDTARVEADRSLAEPTRLALHPAEATTIVDNEVVTSVLAERHRDDVASEIESGHDRERGAVADSLRMLH